MTIGFDTYAEFLETIPDAAVVVDRTGIIVLENPQSETLFGYKSGDLKGRSVQILLPAIKRTGHARHMEAYFANPTARAMGAGLDLIGQCTDGSEIALDIMLKPITIGGTLYALCVMRDITEQRRTEAALNRAIERERELARTDYLTGAANARLFHDLAQMEIDRFYRYKRPFTIVYIDLDNFKGVNDQFGHGVGDQLLCAIVHDVGKRLRKTDCIARLGGDEFALLLTEANVETAHTVVPEIHQSLLIEMKRNGWPVTFSIGVLTCLDVPQTSDELIKLADDLMYTIKNNGKNGIAYAIYNAGRVNT